MALQACPECGREVSSRAPACPGCGFPIAPLVKLGDEYACGRCYKADQTVTVRSVLLSDRSFSEVGGTIQLSGNMETVAAEAGRYQLLAGSSWVIGTRGFRKSTVSRSAITLSGSLDLSGNQTSALADTLLSLIPPPVTSGDYLEGLRKYAELLYCRRCGVVTGPSGEPSDIGPAVFLAFGHDVILSCLEEAVRHHYRSSSEHPKAKRFAHHELVVAVEPVDDTADLEELRSRVLAVVHPVGTSWEDVGSQYIDMGTAKLRMGSIACRPKSFGQALLRWNVPAGLGLKGHFSWGQLEGNGGKTVVVVACISYLAEFGSAEDGLSWEASSWQARFEDAARDALSLVRSLSRAECPGATALEVTVGRAELPVFDSPGPHGLSARPIARLRPRTRVRVLERVGNWVQVEPVEGDGARGWVDARMRGVLRGLNRAEEEH